jgi:predicted nucleic acid-binding protein
VNETITSQVQNIYIDTNALRALNFQTHITPLLHASKQGVIKLYLCEAVLWERARQYYENEKDRLITVSSTLPKIVAWFKTVFEEHGVKIIDTPSSDIENIKNLLEDKNRYFKAENVNDQRDALIFSVALSTLAKHDTLILCEEHNLSNAFEQEGYIVRKDTKRCIEEITANITAPRIITPDIQRLDDKQVSLALSPNFKNFIEAADHQYLIYKRELPVLTEDLSTKLHNMQTLDIEVRKKVLGYAQWFSPVSKEELKRLLETGLYKDGLIENSAQRLLLEELLVDTGNHWLPNTNNQVTKHIFEQAMSAVMPEILEIIGAT